MPLLCYKVKHFFYIPPVSVVWRRTASQTRAFATDTHTYSSGKQNRIPFDETETVSETLDCSSILTRLIAREYFITLCVLSTELEFPAVNVIYTNDGQVYGK
jgi:hypothetical protein